MKTRLEEFKIDGLFGLYSHRIALNLTDRITIIIGPNGRGKTVCLKFIEALFRKRYTYFAEIPFRTAEFTFTGGEKIILKRSKEPEKQAAEGASTTRSIDFTLSAPEKKTITWAPTTVDIRSMRELRRYIPPEWVQVSPDLWVDHTDGEEITFAELLERFQVPSKLNSVLRQDLPEDLAELVNTIDCHLIETQRLLVLPSGTVEEDVEYGAYGPARRRFRGSRLAIQQKAQKLKTILKDTLTTYANLSQSLDRSFPFRVFESQGFAKLSQDLLRQELKQLDGRREALMGAGILDREYHAVTMPSGIIQPGVAMALEMYVKDTTKKLDVFNNLLSMLDLFEELIENRFIDKTLHIDRENGFKIISKTQHEVPLDRLSSGEQHQLILIFDLLFDVTEKSLILIDEPELSLHVAWQKTFIESLTRIIALNGFDVLLATHSPAVVAKHFSLTVELGEVE
jgi:ABC-type branched-subunit amino acid transport system ATPase component